jgi:hypothetical protein
MIRCRRFNAMTLISERYRVSLERAAPTLLHAMMRGSKRSASGGGCMDRHAERMASDLAV